MPSKDGSQLIPLKWISIKHHRVKLPVSAARVSLKKTEVTMFGNNLVHIISKYNHRFSKNQSHEIIGRIMKKLQLLKLDLFPINTKFTRRNATPQSKPDFTNPKEKYCNYPTFLLLTKIFRVTHKHIFFDTLPSTSLQNKPNVHSHTT